MSVDITAKLVVGFKVTADEYKEAKRKCTNSDEWDEVEDSYLIRANYWSDKSDCDYVFTSKVMVKCDAGEIETLDITKCNDYDEVALKKAFKTYFPFSEAKLGIHLCVIIY